MIGQGRPKASLTLGTCPTAALRRGRTVSLALMAVAVLLCPAAAAEEMRVRIAWGGGSERLWDGTVTLAQGEVAEPRPLGIEADEPGSMWVEAGRLIVRQRTARAYDGVDLLLRPGADDRLVVELTAADSPEEPILAEIPLAQLLDQFHDQPLDEQGNRLFVRLAPGSQLQVEFSRDSLVFSPGETFSLTIRPNLASVAADKQIEIDLGLAPANGDKALWESQHKVQPGGPADLTLDIPLPKQEGVYDLSLRATPAASWQEAVRHPLKFNRPIAQRTVQMVVLAAESPRGEQPSTELQPVVEIDPTNPRWWELLSKLPKLPKISRLWKGPLGNGHKKVVRHALGELVRLDPNAESPDVSWEAYTLPIREPGRPHIVEVRYPSDRPQTLGISILEPNAAGALMPIGLDSGVDVPDETVGSPGAARWRTHRLIFWPRTTSPLVLMANRRDEVPAYYGKIRVLAGWDRLPPAASVTEAPEPGERRMLAGYLERPLFPENFSAPEALDRWSGRSLDDWSTFYDGSTRLVDYLRHVGYNGLMLTVLADGSTIYPSRILEPTPRYDTGVFFATGQDPVRKDVLEALFRLFDREGMQLIPTLDFGTPLPELETLRRQQDPQSVGLEWIGPDGATWLQSHATRRGLAPYYNTLHPRVQEAMRRVVREVIARYGHHPSFGGLAIQLSAHGYAQLPGPQWGMDDATIARFQRDTRQEVPGNGSTRFTQRAAFLTRQKPQPWLAWRAEQLVAFYREIRRDVAAARPDARLYLAGAHALSGKELRNDLQPALPRRITLAEALLQVGIDARQYEKTEGIVLLRPEPIVSGGTLGDRALSLEMGQMADADSCFRDQQTPGSLFFHRPREVRIASFDGKSPFQPAYTWLVTQPVPSARHNRCRFVHSLAGLDARAMFDGGWLLTQGQEQAVRHLVAAYCRLPAVRFQTADASRSQPVTFRYATHAGRTYVYVVNDAPFATTSQVRLQGAQGARLDELTGQRKVAPLQFDAQGASWSVELEPYDLVAVSLSAPGVKLVQPQVALPGAVESGLVARIRDLGVRAATLRRPPQPVGLLANPGFEQEPEKGRTMPGWAITRRTGVAIGTERGHAYRGDRAARIQSEGPIACLVSHPFDPPETGRLSMSVWLRVDDTSRQPPLRLAIEGKLHGQDYYRFAPIGRADSATPANVPIDTDWAEYVFQVDDLPLEGLSQMQVRFDLMGAGDVWIDEVALYHLRFSDNEFKELSKLITLAYVTLQNGQIGECVRLLDGYWPRFLQQHVPLVVGPVAQRTSRPEPAPRRSASQPGILDRVKGILPF